VNTCLITEKSVQEKIMPELSAKKGKKKEESA
jgi:ATP-dependent Clp protease ATP-binding subunit ClpX